MFRSQIDRLKREDLLRRPVSRSSPQGPVITVNGRRCLNFASNDYLGLAAHPDVLAAARSAAEKYGFGAGASRLLGGGTILHERLEAKMAAFKSAEAALLLNSGYSANTGIIPSIAREGDVLFSDELNHASIIDGCRLSRATTLVYPHGDVTALGRQLSRQRRGRRIVVTDSVFSMDGDIAPLCGLYELCERHGAILYIDDAHATGVMGGGKGGLAHAGLSPADFVIQMGTFSKALGSFGAYAACSGETAVWLTNTARSFMYSTALPPAVVAASLAALAVLRREPRLIARLWENRAMLADGLTAIGYETGASETPIIPLLTGTTRAALRLSAYLAEKGIYAPAIRPPTVREPRVRLTVSAAHTPKQIGKLLAVLRGFGRPTAVRRRG